jgi:hypothetical protein
LGDLDEVNLMNNLLHHLETSQRTFMAAVHGLTPDLWQRRAGPDQWSVFEVMEHVAVVEIGCHDMVTGPLFRRPCTPEQRLQVEGKDAIIADAMRDRTTRRGAPDMVMPSGRWPTPEEAMSAFTKARTGIIDFLGKETRNLRDYCAPHPSLKALDGHQWVLFMVEHADRHRDQILEIIRGGDAGGQSG